MRNETLHISEIIKDRDRHINSLQSELNNQEELYENKLKESNSKLEEISRLYKEQIERYGKLEIEFKEFVILTY